MGFTGELYPFQEEARESLSDRGTMMLCMVMGSGKTPTTIATLETLVQQDEISRALIVVPASLKYQWLSEINKFSTSRAARFNFFGKFEKDIPFIMKKIFLNIFRVFVEIFFYSSHRSLR